MNSSASRRVSCRRSAHSGSTVVVSGFGLVAEDHVVDADAGVEPALFVEVERLVDRYRGDRFVNIVEGAIVAERLDAVGEAEEAAGRPCGRGARVGHSSTCRHP